MSWPAQEVAEWQAFDSMSPIGDHGAYLRSAHEVASMAAKEGDTMDKFMIPAMIARERNPHMQSPEEMAGILGAMENAGLTVAGEDV